MTPAEINRRNREVWARVSAGENPTTAFHVEMREFKPYREVVQVRAPVTVPYHPYPPPRPVWTPPARIHHRDAVISRMGFTGQRR